MVYFPFLAKKSAIWFCLTLEADLVPLARHVSISFTGVVAVTVISIHDVDFFVASNDCCNFFAMMNNLMFECFTFASSEINLM
jgi:hypothetical protein